MTEQHDTEKKRPIRRSQKVTEAIYNSRTTIIVNMVIEFFSALVLFIGIIYFFRFMFIFKNRMVETYFRIFLGAMFVFSAGWFSFIFLKIREQFRQLKKSLKNENNSK
ncbi:hypothetical protein ACFL6H_04855 [Candidatus Latescibacterota bacterium]